MTIQVDIDFKDPDTIARILDECETEKERDSVRKYFECGDYGTIRGHVFVQNGIPCIVSAIFLRKE